MMILALGETLESIDENQLIQENKQAVFITDSRHAKEAMSLAGMIYEGDINL